MNEHERILPETSLWKKFVWGTIFFIACILIVYAFLLHTNRGSSIALYIAGGWNAPISIRFDCAKETDSRVLQKFQLPLDFDEATKDELKGFWYYAYYRECLFRNGFDFKGTSIPESKTSLSETETQYINAYGGFSFTIPGKAYILYDNTLNVDFDDTLLESNLVSDYTSVSIETYTRHAHFTSFENIEKMYAEYPLNHVHILKSETTLSNPRVPILTVTEPEGVTSLIFITEQGYIVRIYSKDLDVRTQQSIIESLQLLEVT